MRLQAPVVPAGRGGRRATLATLFIIRAFAHRVNPARGASGPMGIAGPPSPEAILEFAQIGHIAVLYPAASNIFFRQLSST